MVGEVMNKYICAYCSGVGIRKKTNQDSMLLKQIETKEGQIVFAALCDGMGGMSKGELASATVIRDFDHWFDNSYLLKGLDWKEQGVITQWKSALSNSNQELIQYGNENIANHRSHLYRKRDKDGTNDL
ncbi:MAG TPA: hypothetical protein DCP96_02065 [Lachnospiraceae bacterium]|jgi:serine/threonine protein phosphatase PrpC|nr:hypothetical protein [Lachnospiraceae bacterium]HBE08161.1 hypothetical protein [Lachnospiraceae bacterium]